MTLVLALVLPGSGLGAPSRQATGPVTVSAAISLTEVLEEAARVFSAAGGPEVRFNFAGSNVLARQITSGAPVDLFISADEAQMAVVEAAGLVAEGTRVDLLGNHLAVVLSASAPGVTSAADLAQPGIRRIALGDPAAVPAGAYARQYLEKAGVWEKVAAKVVPVANVRAALTAAQTATADAAIVYESDLAAASRVRLAFVVSGADAPAIVYPAAIIARSKNRAAADRFLLFLRSPAAAALFTKYRFEPHATVR